MATEPIQGLPYPALTGAPPNVPADLKALADAVAPRTVMRFASIAARDAALPSPVDGMVCYVTSDKAYYARVGGEWVVFWSDTGWQSIEPSSGFAANYIDIRRIGKLVVLRINTLTRTSGSGPATAFVIPPGFRPTEEHYPAWSSPSPNHTTWITTGGELRGSFTTTGNTYRATTVYPVA